MLRINIGFRLPKEIAYDAIRIATNIAKSKDHLFFLDGVTVLPHIMLYAPIVEETTVPHVLDAVEKISSHLSEIYLTLKEITERQGFVSIEFGLTPDIKKIQEEIVNAVKPFRVEDVDEKFENGADYYMNLSQGSLQSLEKYGSVGIINFHPHLSLFRMKDEIDGQLGKRKVVWSHPRFLVNKIGVFVMGESGVCNELIEEFPLKNQI